MLGKPQITQIGAWFYRRPKRKYRQVPINYSDGPRSSTLFSETTDANGGTAVLEIKDSGAAMRRLDSLLGHRRYGTVDQADLEVGVGTHQLGGTGVVAKGQVGNLQLAGDDRADEGGDGGLAQFAPDQVIDLDLS